MHCAVCTGSSDLLAFSSTTTVPSLLRDRKSCLTHFVHQSASAAILFFTDRTGGQLTSDEDDHPALVGTDEALRLVLRSAPDRRPELPPELTAARPRQFTQNLNFSHPSEHARIFSPPPTRENTTMLADRYGLALSTTSDAARDAYVQGNDLALTFYPGAIDAFD